MNKQIAQELKIFTEVVCKRYSFKDRENNFNNETFKIQEIIPTSDHTATVIYEKNTLKRAACFPNQKIEVERHNYKHNFN